MKENEMIHTGRVLIVEGKYDAARLSHLTDAMILLTDGFGIYSDKKRQQLFKALAQKNMIVCPDKALSSDSLFSRIEVTLTCKVLSMVDISSIVSCLDWQEANPINAIIVRIVCRMIKD